MTDYGKDFVDFYFGVTGKQPLRWQCRMAMQFAQGKIPGFPSLPTGSGKTHILIIWAWAVSRFHHVPTRIYWVIDRCIVVDSATDEASRLIDHVPGLQITTLRGGLGLLGEIPVDDPTAPAIIVTTVAQAGSHLLGRANGASNLLARIHAALIGEDAMIVIDEAHLSAAFCATLNDVAGLNRSHLGLPWYVMELTATPRNGTCDFELGNDIEPILMQRINRPKYARVIKSSSLTQSCVDEASRFREAGAKVVLVVVNTVRDARVIFENLSKRNRACLIVGQARRWERDRILDEYGTNMLSRYWSADRQPLYVVATSTVEVGADIDADALVTEMCLVSGLRQRFGRLNRQGNWPEAQAAIIVNTAAVERLSQSKKEEDKKTVSALKTAIKWLDQHARKLDKKKVIDMCSAAFAERNTPDEPAVDFPPLLMVDLEALLRTTSPAKINVEPWIYGYTDSTPEVSIVWREDIPAQDEVAAYLDLLPIAAQEVMSVPVYVARGWLQSILEGRVVYGDRIIIVDASVGGHNSMAFCPESTVRVEPKVNTNTRVLLDQETSARYREGLVSLASLADKYFPDRKGMSRDERESQTVVIAAVGTRYVVKIKRDAAMHGAGEGIDLSDHCNEVSDKAFAFSARLSPELRKVCELAGTQHDIGKGHDGFQRMLGRQAGGKPLAKSRRRSLSAALRALALSGLPRGWRHEMNSLAKLSVKDDIGAYLVATHHGYGCCSLPAAPDSDLWQACNGSAWPELYDRLTGTYGQYGLPYLEAIVRLADFWVSDAEVGK